MVWQRSRPRLDRENRAFWTGGAEGKLNITRCDDCGQFTHPPREICRHCQSENVGPHAVAGTGLSVIVSIFMRLQYTVGKHESKQIPIHFTFSKSKTQVH